jgi:hypothetical protein
MPIVELRLYVPYERDPTLCALPYSTPKSLRSRLRRDDNPWMCVYMNWEIIERNWEQLKGKNPCRPSRTRDAAARRWRLDLAHGASRRR